MAYERDPWVRFHGYVSPDANGCWLWIGSLTHGGYGRFGFGPKTVRAHRWSYEYIGGKHIPEGYHVDHLCRVKNCVNPDHLEAVSPQTNLARRDEAKTHCIHGHPLSGDNLKIRPHDNARLCLECIRKRDREYKAAKRNNPILLNRK